MGWVCKKGCSIPTEKKGGTPRNTHLGEKKSCGARKRGRYARKTQSNIPRDPSPKEGGAHSRRFQGTTLRIFKTAELSGK